MDDDLNLSSGDIASEPSLADDLTAAASPAPLTDAAADPTPAATVPGAADAGATPGPMPFDRHKAILDGAYRERDDYKARLEQLAWAEQVQPQQLQLLQQYAQEWQRLLSDPHAFYAELGRRLGQSRAQPQAEPDFEPDLRADDGTPVYSAPKLQRILARQAADVEARVMKQVAPVVQHHQTTQLSARAQAEAHQQFSEASTWEGFNELRGDILAAMQRDGRITLHSAYQRAYKEKYLPSRDQKVRDSVMAELRHKGAASTEQPGKAAAHTPKRMRDMDTRDVFDELAPSFGL